MSSGITLPDRSLRVYVATVIGAGAIALALLHSRLAGLRVGHPAECIVLSLLLVVTELTPIHIERKGAPEIINISGVFACALLLRWDLALAVAVQAGASLLYALLRRSASWKCAFNIAQYALSLTAAATVFHGVVPMLQPGHTRGPELIAALAAGCTYFVVNNTLMGMALARLEGVGVITFLANDLAFQASVNGVSAALAPLMLIAADQNLWLVALVLVPLAAVHRSATLSLDREHRIRHDLLTGLPNGGAFREMLTVALDDAAPGHPVAVMMVDVDNFTELNDTLGHQVGDELLRQMANRLSIAVEDLGTVARFGGDEFAILIAVDATDLTVIADRVLTQLRRPFDVEGNAFDLNASLGIAAFPTHGDSVDVLIQRADVALNLAKQNRVAYEVYTPDRDQHSRRRLMMLGELRQAVEAGQLFVVYQPKADIRTGQITGVEALLRWRHPTLGAVPPDDFIALAEHTGMVRELTSYVLGEVIDQLDRWRRAGWDIKASVNLSGRDLHDLRLPERVRTLLDDRGVPSRSLVFEVTETALASEPERATRVLTELAAMSIGISMDDYGTGYSSLAQLRELPVDELKIDRSFVSNMLDSESDRIIVRSTIDLARNLGLHVVAEGVETAEVWDLLDAWGCDTAQGYYIGRAVPAADLQPTRPSLTRNPRHMWPDCTPTS